MEWFYYDCNGDPLDPQSYYSVLIPFCPGSSQLCAVRAIRQLINGQPRPIFTPALQAEITGALSTGTESANVLLKS